ncbi:MAG: carbohydrate ABC transporter permease [Methanosarcinales archaeon]
MVKKILLIVGFLFFLSIILFPFYWMILSSTKTFGELFAFPPIFLPSEITLKAYKEVIFEQNFLYYFANSLYVSLITVCLTISLSTLGAYAVARLQFKGKSFMSQTILLVYTFPPILLVIPLFAMLAKVGLTDSLNGLILAYLAQTLPVSLYMLASYFRTIPVDIEEAGIVDGCSRLEVIRYLTIPLSLPAIATVALYTFMITWNEFLFAFIFLFSPEKYTLSIGVVRLFQSYHTAWDMVMAASVIVAIPVIVMFLCFEKYLEKGLVAGGVKG